MGCVDDVLREPRGGTHNDPAETMAVVGEKLKWHLAELRALPIDVLLEQRYNKFRNIAQFYTAV
jgi:acetyl-CoA carboxylase carboxyl transferase subunit alpha